MASAPDAAAIVGALADDDRRSVFAAVQLGACDLGAIGSATGLVQPQAAKALGRLVDAGLVSLEQGRFVVAGDTFRAAARVALTRPRSTEHDAAPVEARKVLDVFVAEGRITSIPSAGSKRRVVLDWLAQHFEPGQRYSEPMVNLVIGQCHPDTAALRRYLVDEGLMSRDAGEYWRSGGTTWTTTER